MVFDDPHELMAQDVAGDLVSIRGLTFRFPRSLALLRSRNPRVIAEDVWPKLWAGLNPEQADLRLSSNRLGSASLPRYPLVMMRALAMIWLFAGLRKDEIAGLRVGCVRRQTRGASPERKEGASVCLLDVPANKTSGACTKPVHSAVRETITAWQELRPAMQAVIDEKTGEVFQVLFGYRGRAPGTDARGSITSHGARSTIATQLYNANKRSVSRNLRPESDPDPDALSVPIRARGQAPALPRPDLRILRIIAD